MLPVGSEQISTTPRKLKGFLFFAILAIVTGLQGSRKNTDEECVFTFNKTQLQLTSLERESVNNTSARRRSDTDRVSTVNE